jgi:hypothetical protein
VCLIACLFVSGCDSSAQVVCVWARWVLEGGERTSYLRPFSPPLGHPAIGICVSIRGMGTDKRWTMDRVAKLICAFFFPLPIVLRRLFVSFAGCLFRVYNVVAPLSLLPPAVTRSQKCQIPGFGSSNAHVLQEEIVLKLDVIFSRLLSKTFPNNSALLLSLWPVDRHRVHRPPQRARCTQPHTLYIPTPTPICSAPTQVNLGAAVGYCAACA